MAWTERYVRADAAGGADGTNDTTNPTTGAWTWVEMATNMAAGHRVNVRAGTLTQTAVVSSTNAGTISSPIWIRGFNTTIGDLDDIPTSQLVSGTDAPLISHTANYSLFSGNYVKWSNIHFKSSVAARPALYYRSGTSSMRRCRFEHTGTGSTDYSCLVDTASYRVIHDCHFLLSNASATAPVINIPTASDLINCVIEGPAGSNLVNMNAPIGLFDGCLFNGGNIGLNWTTTAHLLLHVKNSTFYNQASDAIRMTNTAASGPGGIVKNYFHTIGGYAINASAATLGNVYIANNCYYNLTSGQLNGIHESLQFDVLTDSADEFVNKATKDFTLKSTSNGYGVVNLIEKTGPSSYFDVGAIQHNDPVGGSNTIIIPRKIRVM